MVLARKDQVHHRDSNYLSKVMGASLLPVALVHDTWL